MGNGGNGGALMLEAPTYILADSLTLSGTELFVRPSRGAKQPTSDADVVLIASDALLIGGLEHKRATLAPGVSLSVTWPGAKAYPWTDFAIEPFQKGDADISPAFRRLRKIVVSFRSHSRGALMRLAAKIEHRRMVK